MSKPFFAILRALTALAIGALLIANPASATMIIVVLIGVLFLLIGIVSLIYNVKAVRAVRADDVEQATQFPLTSVGCILFGLVLALMPSAFIQISMYILGAFLILAGAFQIVNFRAFSKTIATPTVFYVVSVLIMLAGIFIFINPIISASLPVVVLGVSFLVYGLMEIVVSVQAHIALRRISKAEKAERAEQAEASPDGGETKEYITFDGEGNE